jgi:hypothetical protein
MPIPMCVIDVREESERSWEDAAARAIVVLGRQLVKNIDSLNFETSREGDDQSPGRSRYEVEVKISLSRKRLDRRVRIAG